MMFPTGTESLKTEENDRVAKIKSGVRSLMFKLNCNTDAHMMGHSADDMMKIVDFLEHPGEHFYAIANAIGQIMLHEPMLTDYNFKTESYAIAELEKGVSHEDWIVAVTRINKMNAYTHVVLERRRLDHKDYLYGRIEIRKEVLNLIRGNYMGRYRNVRGLMSQLSRSAIIVRY